MMKRVVRVFFSALVLSAIPVAGCAAVDDGEFSTLEQAASLQFEREHVVGDVYHYEFTVPIGDGPNASLRLHRIVRERAPFHPRRSERAAMLLHGDFSTFLTNFAPNEADPDSAVSGLAPYLAQLNVDVWGLDRRWTLATADGDVSDFAEMGVAEEIDDLEVALGIARAVRRIRRERGKIALVGFSHGAQLAYLYASLETTRPRWRRHIDALVPLDFYGELGPDQLEAKSSICEDSAEAYDLVAAGIAASSNEFFIDLAQRAIEAPEEPSPFIPGYTNREEMLFVLGQTYAFVPYAPFYHLLAPIIEDGVAIGLSETAESAAASWFANATPYQSILESADFDAMLCGEGALPVDASLADIDVPLFYIGAAGGVGALGLHSTTQVSSTVVDTLVVSRGGSDDAETEFGHGDLLFADDAGERVWEPIASWLLSGE